MLRQFADGFNRVAWTVLEDDGISAANSPTRSTTIDQPEGVVQLLPQSQYGLRVTGLEACIDARMDYARGLRVILLSYGGDMSDLAKIVARQAEFGGYFNDSVASPFNDGLTLPDPTFIGGSQVAGLYAHVDYSTIAMTTPVANIANVTAVTQNRSDVALKFGEERGAIYIEPRRSVAAIAVRLSPITGNPLTTILRGASLRSVVRGYNLTRADVEKDASGRYEPQTPGRFNNTLREGMNL